MAFSTGHRSFILWGPSVSSDIANLGLVAQTIRRFGCQGALHFALRLLAGVSVTDPAKDYSGNVGATLGPLV